MTDVTHYRIHFCIDVRGLLRLSDAKLKRQWGGCFTLNGRRLVVGREIRDMLLDELALGHELLPTTKECVGFSYKTGCPRHPIDEAATESTP